MAVSDREWGPFPETVLYFEGAGHAPVDLRRPVSAEIVALLRGLTLTQPFGIVTAYNPRGVTLPASVNAGRAADLRATLERRGIPFIGAEGRSVDESHREPGVAIMRPQHEVVALAREYEQLGVFWFDGTRFWIVPVLAQAEAIVLPHAPSAL